MNELDVLIAAREWLSEPSHWTTGSLWRDLAGCPIRTQVRIADVASTCGMGAAYLAAMDPSSSVIRRGLVGLAIPLLHEMAREMGYPDMAQLNDAAGYEKVLELFDRTISKLTEEIYGGLAEPSVPLVVPAPNEEPREIPYAPIPSGPGIDIPVEDPEPFEAPPVETPERVPVPA